MKHLGVAMNSGRDRAANSTIKGFEYQFLMTQKLILKKLTEDSKDNFVIEGVEDLDIYSDSLELSQFKYYENTECTPSTFQKAIAYMYCHWKKKKEKNIKYKLYIYNKDAKKTNIDPLKILGYQEASKIRKKEINEDGINKQSIKEFSKYFEVIPTEEYSALKNEVVNLVHKHIKVSVPQSEEVYMPLIAQYIHDLAINPQEKNRTINKEQFLGFIENIKHSLITNFTAGVVEDKILLKSILNRMVEVEHSNTHNYNYVLIFGSLWQLRRMEETFVDISRLFSYPGRKITNQTLTILCDFSDENLLNIKKNILKIKRNQAGSAVMNDGYESVVFTKEVFNLSPTFTTNRSCTKYENVAFNFRLASLNNGKEIIEELEDPYVITFDYDFEYDGKMKVFTGFSETLVDRLMEGLSK